MTEKKKIFSLGAETADFTDSAEVLPREGEKVGQAVGLSSAVVCTVQEYQHNRESATTVERVSSDPV
eukprot:m.284602 g.284602  ORF g.284602 m.284602 type:complete len:67 (-) comp54964_c1_seq81:861-1061(-)